MAALPVLTVPRTLYRSPAHTRTTLHRNNYCNPLPRVQECHHEEVSLATYSGTRVADPRVSHPGRARQFLPAGRNPPRTFPPPEDESRINGKTRESSLTSSGGSGNQSTNERLKLNVRCKGFYLTGELATALSPISYAVEVIYVDVKTSL